MDPASGVVRAGAVEPADPLDQLLLSLHRDEALSFAEIGEMFGVPSAQVERWHTGLVARLDTRRLTPAAQRA